MRDRAGHRQSLQKKLLGDKKKKKRVGAGGGGSQRGTEQSCWRTGQVPSCSCVEAAREVRKVPAEAQAEGGAVAGGGLAKGREGVWGGGVEGGAMLCAGGGEGNLGGRSSGAVRWAARARARVAETRAAPRPPAHLLLLFLLPGRALGLAVVTRGHPGSRYHLIFLGARRRGARDQDRAGGGGRRGGTGPGAGGTGSRAGRTAAAGGWAGQRISSMTTLDLRPPAPVSLLRRPPLVPGWGGGSLSP